MNIEKIQEHYDHAREKHPYLCYSILPPEAYQQTKDDALKEVQSRLLRMRKELKDAVRKGECSAFAVAVCEWLEFLEAVMMGNHAFAIEECYDIIAVLLRVIDVLEGRQPLGRAKEEGEQK